ncbi:hypothetical protein ACLB2K_055959 [Fragaria x ananassa]
MLIWGEPGMNSKKDEFNSMHVRLKVKDKSPSGEAIRGGLRFKSGLVSADTGTQKKKKKKRGNSLQPGSQMGQPSLATPEKFIGNGIGNVFISWRSLIVKTVH